MIRARGCALVLAVAFAGGCGAQETEPRETTAAGTHREANFVGLRGIEYRVTMFRPLNGNIAPDGRYFRGPAPADGYLVYAAFVQACNESDEVRETTARVTLRTANGDTFARLMPRPGNAFAYRPTRLEPGACIPAPGTVANEAAPGAVAAFELPVEVTRDRPLLLELRARPDGSRERAARIELDL